MNAGDALLLKPARGCRNDVPVESKKWCDESLAAIAFAVIPPSISLIYTFDMPLTPAQLHVVFELLPPYLPDLHALLALLGTSHSIRCTTLAALTPHTLLGLLSRTRTPVDLSDPLHLISYLAPGLQTWLAETHNRRRFIRAVRHGVPGMSRMARRYPAIMNVNAPTDDARPLSTTLTLEALSRNTARRQEIVTSLTDLVDKCVGVQWYSTPNFWDGGAEDAVTLWAEPDELLWRWVGYGELFGDGMERWYDWLLKRQDEADVGVKAGDGGEGDGEWRLPDHLRAYEVTLRCEYVKYILPDWRTPLEKYMGYKANGVSSVYPYPESLKGGSDDEVSLRDECEDHRLDRVHSDNDDGSDRESDAASEANSSVLGPVLWQEAQLTESADGSQGDAPEFQEAQPIAPAQGSHGSIPEIQISLPEVQEVQSVGPPHVSEGPEPEWDGAMEGAQVTDDLGDGGHVGGIIMDDRPLAEPTVSPTVHPLRATTASGPYAPTPPRNQRAPARWTSERSEHITALLHLFERSPLFYSLARASRHRAIRLAHSQNNMPPCSPAPQRPIRLTPSLQDFTACATCGLAEFGDLQDWKQVFWEDALWTGGWDGLELLFDVWEKDYSNDKARIRRERRARDLEPAGTAQATDGEPTPHAAETTPASPKAATDGENGMHGAVDGRTAQTGRADAPQKGTTRPRSQIPDDHPGLQRLVRIYAQLCRLKDEPKRVEFESIDRPRRQKVSTWLGPVFLGDLRALQWSGVEGRSWEMR